MKNNILNPEYTDALSDSSFRLTAERLVMKSGVRANLKGFDCLADAVILYGTGLCERFCEIYEIIAAYRNISAKSVMREIAYAIFRPDELAERLSQMIGTKITKSDVHSALVIAYLGKVFRAPDAALYG